MSGNKALWPPFEEDPAIGEYYQLVENDEAMSLRYCTPLTVEEGCLSCRRRPRRDRYHRLCKGRMEHGRYRGRPEHQASPRNDTSNPTTPHLREISSITPWQCAPPCLSFSSPYATSSPSLCTRSLRVLGEVGRGVST